MEENDDGAECCGGCPQQQRCVYGEGELGTRAIFTFACLLFFLLLLVLLLVLRLLVAPATKRNYYTSLLRVLLLPAQRRVGPWSVGTEGKRIEFQRDELFQATKRMGRSPLPSGGRGRCLNK